MNIRVNKSERFRGAILRGRERSSIELARETRLTDGISLIPVTRSLLESSLMPVDRKSTRLNSSHSGESRMPSSA